MPVALKDVDLSDIRLPDLERPSMDLKDVKLPKVELPKVELPDIEMPKIDVGKAVKDAAVSVGLVKQPRSRWPWVVGAAAAIAVTGFILMNVSVVRERLTYAASKAGEWVSSMRGGVPDQPVAFTAAETAPITAETTAWGEESSMTTDYPEGFGAEDAPTSDEMATNGRATPAVPR